MSKRHTTKRRLGSNSPAPTDHTTSGTYSTKTFNETPTEINALRALNVVYDLKLKHPSSVGCVTFLKTDGCLTLLQGGLVQEIETNREANPRDAVILVENSLLSVNSQYIGELLGVILSPGTGLDLYEIITQRPGYCSYNPESQESIRESAFPSIIASKVFVSNLSSSKIVVYSKEGAKLELYAYNPDKPLNIVSIDPYSCGAIIDSMDGGILFCSYFVGPHGEIAGDSGWLANAQCHADQH